MDVLIVASAGNYVHEPTAAQTPDHHVQGYPQYLLEPAARIIEPATGCIVVTVGSIAENGNVPVAEAGRVDYVPISKPNHPSAFTRSGPGIGGSIKPEFCQYGGNTAYDARLRDTRHAIEHSAVSMNRNYLTRLFSTNIGTSFAAPRVSHTAARIFGKFPGSSANLVRALLAASAENPAAAQELLDPISADAKRHLCGYDLPSFERATQSDTNRVLLHADGAIPFDKFHIYEVPIPDEIYQERGVRKISVALAFDPPVRHSRLDYLGTTMSFRLIRGRTVV